MKSLTKPLILWPLLGLISLAAAIGSYVLFPRAFPLIHVNLIMDRTAAIDQAQKLASTLHIGPDQASASTSFITDETAKTFVELEHGVDAVVTMMRENLYQPFTWTVRLFKEFDPNEGIVWFTPEGTPYGFLNQISEDKPGSALTRDAAQAIASNIAAAAPWNINFAQYQLVEASQEVLPSNRIDHTFVYERPTPTLGTEGRYRLRIVVRGDTVSEIRHSIKVPDSFLRRYKEMRSANETIAAIANMFFMLVYVLCGCVIGLLWLVRRHWVLWKHACAWAALISGLNAITSITQLPLYWMHYNTALSRSSFLAQFGIGIIIQMFGWFFFLFLIFMAAESLTRRALGTHIQFWKLWSPSIAGSNAILGRTIAGYLIVPISLCFTCIFYVTTTALWKWWTPSSALFDPDILASYAPWLQSITLSLQAGFMEECLFRAVPLACAALLGERYGKKRWWIIGALILQALVFGAAHANYPTQPAYARVVELFSFSILMGLIYLAYGLLPIIITHFIYDVVWFALPLFIAQTPNAWINQAMVIGLALIPLAIALAARLKNGSIPLTPIAYNNDWKPLDELEPEQPPITYTHVTFSPKIFIGIGLSACIGVLLFALYSPWHHNGKKFTITRPQAERIASDYLEKSGVLLTDWRALTYPITDSDRTTQDFQHRFVWRHTSHETYEQLLNSYLTPPHWIVRFITHNGSLVDRSEEYRVYLSPDGTMFRFEHLIPESREGKQLTKQQAIDQARTAIIEQFEIPHDQLTELSAVATKQPHRLDWLITFSTPHGYALQEGQARITVSIAGDQIVDMQRFVHVPEAWKRDQEHAAFVMTLLKQICSFILYALLVCGVFMLYRGTAIQLHTAWPYIVFIGILCLIDVINALPKIMIRLNTSQPFFEQLFRSVGFELIFTMIYGMFIALKINAVNHAALPFRVTRSWKLPLMGYGIGILFAGLLAFFGHLLPSAVPIWPTYATLAQLLPVIGTLAATLMQYITMTIVLFVVLHLISALAQLRTHKKIIAGILSIVLITCLITLATETLSRALIAGPILGIIFALMYMFVLQFDLALTPLVTGSFFVCSLIQQMAYNAYPHAITLNLIAAGIIVIVSYGWYRIVNRT